MSEFEPGAVPDLALLISRVANEVARELLAEVVRPLELRLTRLEVEAETRRRAAWN